MRVNTGALCVFATLLTFPTALFGQIALLLKADTHSQLIQNAYAHDENLSCMLNAGMIRRFHRGGYLQRVSSSTRYYYLHLVPAKYRYLRPWSKLFLDRLSRQYYARFKQRLRVTVALQRALARRNANAANAFGARRSSHLTGATLDISKRGMTASAHRWMTKVIYSLREKGYLYAVEEFAQPVYHVMVYRNYRTYVKNRLSGGSGNHVLLAER
jgi:hypothetical protein